MQTFVQTTQQFQGPANSVNQAIRWTGIGVRIAPAPPPGLSAPVEFYWPRSLALIDSTSSGDIQVADSGWVTGDFTGIIFKATELTNAVVKTDFWNIWIAEDDRDLITAPGSSFTAGLVYDPATQTYTSADKAPNVTATIPGTVTVTGTVAISGTVVNNPKAATNLKNVNGTASTVATNISTSLQGGTGTCQGILVSNTGATINLLLQVTGVIIDVIPPNTGRFYQLDPNSIVNIQVATPSSTTTYSATAYYA